mgnify:FL=1
MAPDEEALSEVPNETEDPELPLPVRTPLKISPNEGLEGLLFPVFLGGLYEVEPPGRYPEDELPLQVEPPGRYPEEELLPGR